jgi:hypothetical protein
MKNLFATSILFLVVSVALAGWETRFGAIRLLEGYSAKPESSVDTANWTIEGKNGLIVHLIGHPVPCKGSSKK